MATGDILACNILSTGWEAEVTIEGLSTGGTYLMDGTGDLTTLDEATAKVVFTVVSEGYSSAGVLGTKTRTVYGSRPRMKAYPLHESAEERVDGSNVIVTLALSEYIYADDKAGGAGTSGVNPTVAIAAGFYTKTGVGNKSGAPSVTNASAEAYPKVIARWATVPYQRVTSSLDLEVVAFHRFAEHSKPVACVIFTCDDGTTAPTTATQVAMRKSSLEDGLPCYAQAFTASDYLDNTQVTCNFVAYPWVGDEGAVRGSADGTPGALTLGPLLLLADSDDDWGVTVAVVDPVNGTDGSTEVAADIADLATADAHPCLTIRRALTKIAAFNASAYNQGADAGIIYLKGMVNPYLGTNTSKPTSVAWVTITRHPTVAKESAGLNRVTSAGSFYTTLVRLYDMTVTPGAGPVVTGNTSRLLWNDHIACPAAEQNSYSIFSGFALTYNTFCTADKVDCPFGNYSIYNKPDLIRGCTVTNAEAWQTANTMTVGPRVLLTSSLTSSASLTAGGIICPPAENTIAAYNIATHCGTGVSIYDNFADNTAIVGNVIELSKAAGTELHAMAQSTDPPHHFTNKLCWHNTFTGQRSLIGYNEDPAYPHNISQLSLRNTVFRSIATKHDQFATDGTLTSGWSLLYGVGFWGVHDENPSGNFDFNWYGGNYLRESPVLYVDDQAFTYPTPISGTSTGGGDYHLSAESPCRARLLDAAHLLIPFDLEGSAFVVGGAVGAYATPPTSGGGYRFWTYS